MAYVLPATDEKLSRSERQYGQGYIYTCEPVMCGPVPCPVSRNTCGWRRAPTPFNVMYPTYNGGYNNQPVRGQGSNQGQGQPAQGYGQPYGQSYGYGRK